MNRRDHSLMVVLDHDEYCFLYDQPSFPDLLENLLTFEDPPDGAEQRGLRGSEAREIARGLIGRAHQDV